MIKKYETILAVDPDTDKSGVAVLNVPTKKLVPISMSFPELLDFMKISKEQCDKLVVVVEAGWLNKSNWHVKAENSRRVAALIGNSTGRNHEVGRKIIEMAKHYGIDVVELKPLKKHWNGQDGKITQKEIERFITDFPKRSSQDVRDASLIAWYYAGLPIKVLPSIKQNFGFKNK